MSDSAFLSLFIEEPIYVLKEDLGTQPKDIAISEPETKTIEEAKEAAAPESNQVEEPVAPVYVKPLPTVGDNLKHCIVLVESNEEVLEEALMALLYKIMGSVKRKGEDILIANCVNADGDQIDALLANNNHRHVLAFGTNVFAPLINVGHYEVHTDGPKSFLKGDSLTEIQNSVDKKKALWKALQEMF
ncbi:hypothetical protein [Roseivirga sp.]|uniref:hypothetical protein n=1 Tax=Roseivirga sp. TaxID=1964215 RepID=UPI003B8B21FC